MPWRSSGCGLSITRSNINSGYRNGDNNSLQRNIKHQANIADLGPCKVLEDGYQIQKFVVVRIREPAANRDGMLRVEDVRCGRVVDDNRVLEVSADLGEVLYSVRLGA